VALVIAGADRWAAPSAPLAGVLFALLYAGAGLFTAASYAPFMDLTDPRLGATVFSAFMGMTNLCEAWSARAVGGLRADWTYGGAFAAVTGVSLLALVLLALLPRRTAAGLGGTPSSPRARSHASAEGAFHLHLSSEAGDEVPRDREAQARSNTRRLGREERLEDLGEELRRDSRAGVDNLHDRPLAISSSGDDPPLAVGGILGYALSRVHQEVEEDLSEPGVVGPDPAARPPSSRSMRPGTPAGIFPAC
jgi:hypothetical protein